jgi:hypothetical protein
METKRQGRIARHYAEAAVPHIMALLGFPKNKTHGGCY